MKWMRIIQCVWWEGPRDMRDVWRYWYRDSGALSVMTSGTPRMPLYVCVCVCVCVCNVICIYVSFGMLIVV